MYQEVRKIRDILGEALVDIHHGGSTAVANLKAKPIIEKRAITIHKEATWSGCKVIVDNKTGIDYWFT